MRFLIVDDDPESRRKLRYHIEVEWPDALIEEHQPSSAGGSPESLEIEAADLVLLGHPLADERGLSWLGRLRARASCPPVIVFADPSSEFLAVEAMKAGAAGYFPKSEVKHRRFIDTLRAEANGRGADAAVGVDRVAGAAASGIAANEIAARSSARVLAGGRVPAPDRVLAPDRMPAPGRVLAPGRRERAREHRFVRELHATDVSSIYLAESQSGDRIVYKVLRQTPDASGARLFDRFLQEYEIVARVRHTNVVKIFDLGVGDDHAYLVMEYLPGGSLAQRIARGMKPEEAVPYLMQIASALGAIHEAGVLHRDLKPANIMFRQDGTLALIDFGLAKQLRLRAAITGSGKIFGTPYYMSPEQGHAEPADERSDLYSLGCIAYEMLAGAKPFTASSAMGLIYKHAHGPRPRLPEPLERFQPCLDRLLAAARAERFRSAAEFLEALAGV